MLFKYNLYLYVDWIQFMMQPMAYLKKNGLFLDYWHNNVQFWFKTKNIQI